MKRKSIGTEHSMCVQPTFVIGTCDENGNPDFAPITWLSVTCAEGEHYILVISMWGTKKTKQNVQISEDIDISDGIDLTKLDPVVYSGRYHSIGENLGKIGDFLVSE